MAITLYTLGLSMRAIAKIFHLSPNTVLKWIKAFAKENYEKPAPGNAILVELDEMWHYLKSKKTNSGFGKHIDAKLESLLIGNVEDAIKKHSPN